LLASSCVSFALKLALATEGVGEALARRGNAEGNSWPLRMRAKAEVEVAELSALADRLAALAEERARPWWRRLTGQR
jgi:hypothetical protein